MRKQYGNNTKDIEQFKNQRWFERKFDLHKMERIARKKRKEEGF